MNNQSDEGVEDSALATQLLILLLSLKNSCRSSHANPSFYLLSQQCCSGFLYQEYHGWSWQKQENNRNKLWRSTEAEHLLSGCRQVCTATSCSKLLTFYAYLQVNRHLRAEHLDDIDFNQPDVFTCRMRSVYFVIVLTHISSHYLARTKHLIWTQPPPPIKNNSCTWMCMCPPPLHTLISCPATSSILPLTALRLCPHWGRL